MAFKNSTFLFKIDVSKDPQKVAKELANRQNLQITTPEIKAIEVTNFEIINNAN